MRYLLLLLLIVPGFCPAQIKCKLNIELCGMSPREIQIVDATVDYRYHGIYLPLVSDTLSYTLESREPRMYQIVFYTTNPHCWYFVPVMSENASLSIQIRPDKTYTIKGGKLNDEYQAYLKAGKDKVGLEKYTYKYDWFKDKMDEVYYYTVIRELQRCQLYKEQPDNACHDAYRQLAAVFPTHAYTQLGRMLLDGFGTIHPGGRYIDVEAPDLNGKPVRLSSLIRGKLALVDLWASWCSPCRAKSKSMLPIYEQYKDKGFTVVGIAREFKDTRALRKAVALDGYPWTQLVELDDKQKIWIKYMLGNAGGGLFLIDPQGTIIAINPTPEQVLEAVREHCR